MFKSQRLTIALVRGLTLTALLATCPAWPADDPSAGDGTNGFLEQYAATHRFRLGVPASVKISPDDRSVLFLRSGPRSFVRDLYELEPASGRERVLLTAGQLLGDTAEQLSVEEKARRERMRLVARGITSFQLSEDGRLILVPLSGRLFVYERGEEKVRELESAAGSAIDPRLSPDGRQIACVRSGEVYVTDMETGVERRITHGAGGKIVHGLAEFVAQEEMSRYHGFWWSPDSRQILYQRTDTTGVEVLKIMDPTRPEDEPAHWPYPRPGKQNARVTLGLIPVDGGETTWVEWDHERYEYLARVSWTENGPLTLLVQNRDQTEHRLLAVDLSDGSTSTLLVERDDAWLEIDETMPVWLSDGSRFLWTTEREGAPQLELRRRDGQRIRALTEVDLGLKRFEHLFDDHRAVIVRAGSDATESHLYRVPIDSATGGPRLLTREAGTHKVISDGSGTLYARSSATLDGKRRYEVIGPGNARVAELRSVAETPLLKPNLELTTIGKTRRFHAAIVRPHDLDTGKRYPLIVHVYGGPTSLMVQADPQRYLLDQWIADHGYIVAAVDGRGTPGRGRDWHRAVKHDLIRIPLEDQATAVGLLAAKYPEIDAERVGIYGWSFGGYFAAMAVMRRPDVFHSGVAGAPVIDWRDYDTHYTERYMGLPRQNPEGYTAASALTYAGNLDRPLMIVHGTGDDNVYFMHSLKLADALFRAGKSFDFLPLAGFTHLVPDPLVTRRLYTRILEHFDRSLRRPER